MATLKSDTYPIEIEDSEGNTIGEYREDGTFVTNAVNTDEQSLGSSGEFVTVEAGTAADIQAAIDGLPSGRDYQATVKPTGLFSSSEQIDVPSYTFLDLTDAAFKVEPGFPDGDRVFYSGDTTQQITVMGGMFIGNKANVTNTVHALRIGGKPGSQGDYGDGRHRILWPQIREFTGEGLQCSARRAYIEALTVAQTGSIGIHLKSTDMDVHYCGTWDTGNHGWKIDNSWCEIRHPYAAKAQGIGMLFANKAKHNKVHGGYSENNDLEGILVKDSTSIYKNEFVGMEILNNGQATSSPGLITNADKTLVRYCDFVDDGGTQTNSVKVGSPANRTRIVGIDDSENQFGVSNQGTLTIQDGRVLSPETINMGGTGGAISPTELQPDAYEVLVDAGGSTVTINEIDSVVRPGQVLYLTNVGGEAITLDHNAAVSFPLKCQGGTDDTLGVDLTAGFVYQDHDGAWHQVMPAT